MSAAVLSLWQREVVRFLLDRPRVTSSLVQPVLFWVLFSGALSNSDFRPGGVAYGEYFFVGTLAMVALFTAIFSTITVIEDRKEGFLQGVLVSPAPRSAIALGKILGGTTLGWLLGAVFLCLAPLAGIPLSLGSALASLGVLLVLAFAVTGMGFALAWKMDSTAGYHGVMMVVFMPMLLLSGAFFPLDGAHAVMAWIMRLNPMTYGVGALRHALVDPLPAGVPSFAVCLAVTGAFAVVMFGLGTWMVTRRSARDAR